MGRHLVSFSFFSAWHNVFRCKVYLALTDDFTFVIKDLAGLKAGMLCAGMMIVVFFEMFLPVFSALFLIIKLPKPLR